MKLTLSWLLEYLETSAKLEEILDKLTYIGLEVKEVVTRNSKLTGFTVVKIVGVKLHSSFSNLKICKVDNGNKILQVVSESNNIRVGMKTVFASLDSSALLKSNIVIKPTKILGILSEGKLCSVSELLTIQEENNEIIELSDTYQVGDNFFDFRNLVIDINVTPDRRDCLSVYGIARDLAATGIGTLKVLSIPKITASISSPIDFEILNVGSFISGVYISDIRNKESPKWLKERLESVGMQCISAVIDITNYVMISFGLPIHVYDAKKIEGRKLLIRKANSKERFIDLNRKEYLLSSSIDIISDNKNIHAVAGIISSKHSECTLKTTDIFLESTWLDPISITKSSRQIGISTDSSYRFVHSVDYRFTSDGLSLATDMILKLCGGKASNIVSASNLEKSSNKKKVNLNYQDIKRYGSISISSKEISDILTKLGFSVSKKAKDNWSIEVPSWRSDIAIPADLVEEVVRIYGYDKIKEEPLASASDIETNLKDNLRVLMASRGFYEVYTWSFMSKSVAKKFGYLNKLLIISNPLNGNLNVMRPSIMPNLLQVISYNICYGISDLAIFEIGPIYDNFNYPKYVLSGVRSGSNLPRNHYYSYREIDVFDAKTDLLIDLEFLNVNCENLSMERAKKKYYHPGKSGSLLLKRKIVGHFGELHPDILNFFNIKQKVVGFELMLDYIEDLPTRSRKNFTDYKYQGVKRDFAFIFNEDITAGNIINMIKKSSDLVKEVLIFDIYRGSNIGLNKISIALSITFCSRTHTLTEEEIRRESNSIVNLILKNTGGILRQK